MSEMWLGYAEKAGRREVLMALRRIAPGSAVVFANSAQELRERFAEEVPGTVGAIVGHTGSGVSDMNLAAALVRDGRASEVVLVARGATGSLRSRAYRAGISQVVDATVAPALEASRAARSSFGGHSPEGEPGGRQRTNSQAVRVPEVDVAPMGVAQPGVAAQFGALPQAGAVQTGAMSQFGTMPQLGEAQQPRAVTQFGATQQRGMSTQTGMSPQLGMALQPGMAQQSGAALQPGIAQLSGGMQQLGGAPQPGAAPQLGTTPQSRWQMNPQSEQPAGLALPATPRVQDTAIRPKDASPIVTVASGRGGVGKTALVALLASVASRWDMDVAVVDLDLSCGNLHTCFGVVKGPDLVRIAPDGKPSPESMGRASVRCDNHVHLWGPCERPEMAELVMPHVATLLSYLSTRFDLVLVDTSTTFTDGVAQAVQSCDRMLVVHDERPGAVASAARMSALAVRLGVARTRIVRVINLADPRAKANTFEGRAEVGLETARMHRVVDGGIEAEDLLAAGKVSELASLDCDLTAGVSSLLAQTLAELGRLPDNDAARKAAEPKGQRRRRTLFGKHKEAI